MYGITKRDKRGDTIRMRNVYRCHQHSNPDGPGCSYKGCISEKIIAGAVIPFVSQVLRMHLKLDQALEDAANKYGKTKVEAGLEAEIRAEMAQTRQAKQRVVKAVSEGVFTNEEAAGQISELRQKEQRLDRELAKLNEQEQIRSDYLQVIELLKNRDIEKTFWRMMNGSQGQRRILNRLLSLIFEPASLKISSTGQGSNWTGSLEAYRFTEKFFELISRTNYSNQYADVIIPRGGQNIRAIEMVVAQIQRMLDLPTGP